MEGRSRRVDIRSAMPQAERLHSHDDAGMDVEVGSVGDGARYPDFSIASM
jgi:hypothetical protein